ncbi:MAG: hypothetical protein CML46_04055 [Rhodobacteraceae bacterium]|nr:hypothetical protein [Paracoccaceae bacterium]
MAAQAVAAAHGAARIPAPALFPLRDEPSVGPLAAPTSPGFAPLRARFWAETLTFMADAGTPDPEASLPGHYAGLSARLRDAGAATVWLAGSAQEAIALALVEGLAAEAGATLSVALCGGGSGGGGGGGGGAEGRGLAELDIHLSGVGPSSREGLDGKREGVELDLELVRLAKHAG